MDTSKVSTPKSADELTGLLQQIRTDMPKTYAMIKERADKAGNVAYQQVRRGLRGEPGCFYARERIRAPGKLDRWLVAGNAGGLPGLLPEQLEAEFKAPDWIDLIFVLRADACTSEAAHGAH